MEAESWVLAFIPFSTHPPRPRNYDSDGKLLLAEYEGLDDVAAAHGLAPITSFGDTRPVPEDFEGDPDELAELLGPWDDWFPIVDGLQCVEELALAIRSKATARSLVEFPDELVDELECLAACLRKASETSTLFRLEVG